MGKQRDTKREVVTGTTELLIGMLEFILHNSSDAEVKAIIYDFFNALVDSGVTARKKLKLPEYIVRDILIYDWKDLDAVKKVTVEYFGDDLEEW